MNMAEEEMEQARQQDAPEQAETRREVFIPGDVVGERDARPGSGTFLHKGKVYSSQLGIRNLRSNYVNIVPLGGRYIPHPGDTIVGVICDIGPSNWLVDINAPYYAPLHVNEVPWKVDFGATAKFINVGDVVLAEILMVDEMKKVQVTMNGPKLRKMSSGTVIEISPSKVPRIIGRSGSMIKIIVNYTRCRLFVGQNGRIWIDGDARNILAAIKAIRLIEDQSQVLGLTERVKEFLEAECGAPMGIQQDDRREATSPEGAQPAAMQDPGPAEAARGASDAPSPDGARPPTGGSDY